MVSAQERFASVEDHVKTQISKAETALKGSDPGLLIQALRELVSVEDAAACVTSPLFIEGFLKHHTRPPTASMVAVAMDTANFYRYARPLLKAFNLVRAGEMIDYADILEPELVRATKIMYRRLAY